MRFIIILVIRNDLVFNSFSSNESKSNPCVLRSILFYKPRVLYSFLLPVIVYSSSSDVLVVVDDDDVNTDPAVVVILEST
jgi:hypothetical protein